VKRLRRKRCSESGERDSIGGGLVLKAAKGKIKSNVIQIDPIIKIFEPKNSISKRNKHKIV